MLNIFTLANGRLVQEEIESLEELSKFQPIWVDLESPTLDEKRWIKQYYGLSIPEDAMDEDIEESARFYEEDNGELHIRSDFLIADEDEPRTVRCAFILNQHNADLRSRGVLFSIHDEDVPVFRLLRLRARRAPGLLEDAKEVLLKLFDADAEYSADTLENIYDKLEIAGKLVLSGDVTDAMAGEVLGAIARQEDLNGRIRRNVMDTRRAVSFMMRSKMLNAEQFEEARQILRDIDSLDSHTEFLFEKINFLMDATVGFININQNKIIRFSSVFLSGRPRRASLPPSSMTTCVGLCWASSAARRERPPEVVSPLTLALTTVTFSLSCASCFSSSATQPVPRARPYSALSESPSTSSKGCARRLCRGLGLGEGGGAHKAPPARRWLRSR